MNKRALVLLPILSFVVTGCGYHAGSLISPDLKTVHVAMFENKDFRHEVEFALTEAVKNEVTRRTHLKLADRSTAQTVLEGTITGYEDRVFGFDARQKADEYIVVITVDMALRDRVKNKELWREEAMRGVASYFPGTSDQNTPGTEAEAKQAAIAQIVDLTLSRTFEGW